MQGNKLVYAMRTSRTGLTEVDEQITPTSALTNRQGHDATDVVRRTSLLLRKITNELGSMLVHFRHHVKEEWLDIIV
jgi:hypothetical protein